MKRIFLSAAVLGLLAMMPAEALAAGKHGNQARRGGNVVDLQPAGAVPDQYIVVLRDHVADPHKLARKLAKRDRFTVRRSYGRALKGFTARMSASKAKDLEFDPDVAFVEQDLYVHIDVATLPEGVDRIDAETNVYAVDPVDVDVAIIDTGISDHPELNVYQWVNFSSESSLYDLNGHGTHVAGTVAARGISGVVGVAPGARLWSLKVLNKYGSGYFSDVIEAIDYVTAHADEIEVVNMSLGGVGYLASLRQAIQNSVAAGVVYVVAAGNSNQDVYGANGNFEDKPLSRKQRRRCRRRGTCPDDFIPAAYPEVAAISALADTDGLPGGDGSSTGYGPDDTLASFSNFSRSVVSYNPVDSPGAAIDLAAPGVYIYSTWLDGGFATISGTSMASPHVAGATALYIAENGRANDANGVYDIRQALIDSATPQSEWRGGSSTNDDDGNAEGLVYAAGGGGEFVPPNATPSVSISSPAEGADFDWSEAIAFAGSANDTEDGDLSASLAWTSDLDGPIGTGSSFSALLSDGDHTVTATVTDSGNKTASATRTLSVASAPVGDADIFADAVTYRTEGRRRNRKNLFVTVEIVDDVAVAVGGVSVSIDLYRDGSKIASGTGTTDNQGAVTFRLRRARSGTYSTTVTGVTAGELVWDGESPPNGYSF